MVFLVETNAEMIRVFFNAFDLNALQQFKEVFLVQTNVEMIRGSSMRMV